MLLKTEALDLISVSGAPGSEFVLRQQAIEHLLLLKMLLKTKALDLYSVSGAQVLHVSFGSRP